MVWKVAAGLFAAVALLGANTLRLYTKDVKFYGIQWADDDQLYAGLVTAGIGLAGFIVSVMQ